MSTTILSQGARNVKFPNGSGGSIAYGGVAAVGDGVTDDTQAFLDALNLGRGSPNLASNGTFMPVAIYVPPGTYLVKKTLIIWGNTLFFGEDSARPTVVLGASNGNFNSGANPFIVTVNGYSLAPYSTDWYDRSAPFASTNNTFWIDVRDINFTVQSGNPGCTDVFLYACAQQCSLRNSILTGDAATNNCIRTDLTGGGGILHNLICNPGGTKAALFVNDTSEIMCRGCTFNGPVNLAQGQQHNFIACAFNNNGGTGFVKTGAIWFGMNDCTIGSGTPFNVGGSYHLENVKWPSLASVPAALQASSDSTGRVNQFTANNAFYNGVSGAGTSSGINGSAKGSLYANPAYPRPGPACVNVKSAPYNAAGNGVTDDTAAIKAAYAAVDEVFFPLGTYVVSDTITLRPGQKMFGHGVTGCPDAGTTGVKAGTCIFCKSGSAGFGAGSTKPVLSVTGRGVAGVVISQIQIFNGATGLALLWNGDQTSQVLDCHLAVQDADPGPLVIFQSGGGFFENGWWPAGGVSAGTNGIQVNSTDPLYLYVIEPEHYTSQASIFNGAKNVYALNFQFEHSPSYVTITNCESIVIQGVIMGNFAGDAAFAISITSSKVSIFGTIIKNAPSGIIKDGGIFYGATSGGSYVILDGYVRTTGIHYVDGALVTGLNNGSSWVDAWRSIGNISGLSAGDTVYLSGGASASSLTYNISAWSPAGGSAGNPITYKIGQDAQHNGTAIFNAGSNNWIGGSLNYVVISGDAGDGSQHFKLVATNNGAAIDCSGSTGLRISYVTYPAATGSLAYFNGGTAIEIDHVYFYKLVGTASANDNAIYFDVSGTLWDTNLIHDCTFYIPRSSSGDGDDCIQSGSSSISIYNNIIIAYTVTYPRGQHQDGYQPLTGSYYKVYNNYFQDIANYCVFGDAYVGDFAHFWVYNNILVLADPSIRASAAPQGIVIGQDGGAFSNMGRAPNFTDVIIANNLSDGYLNHSSFVLNNVTSHPSTFTNCLIANNVYVDGGGLDTTGNTTTPTPNNVAISAASGSSNFVSYTQSSSTNNYHLLAGAGSLIGQGVNESSYFTVDKDGNARRSSGSWDIGPYIFTGVTDTTAPTVPASLAAAATSSTSITLSWQTSTDPDNTSLSLSYPMEHMGGVISSFTQFAVAPGVSSGTVTFIDTGLTPSTLYSYRIRARDSANNQSAYTATVTKTTLAGDTTPPTIPGSLTASAVSSSQINLAWQQSTDVDNPQNTLVYYIDRALGAGAFAQIVVTSAGAQAYNDTGLSPSSTYSYRIRSYDGTNFSGYSTGPPYPSATTSVAPSIPVFIQAGEGDSSGSFVTAQSATFAAPQAAGNCNIIAVGWNSSTVSVTSVSDSAGNTYAACNIVAINGNYSQVIWRALNIISSSGNVVTVTMTGSTQGLDVRILEYSGIQTVSGALDATSSNTGATIACDSGPLTTTAPNDLLLAACYVSARNQGPGAGFTQRILGPGYNIVEDAIATTPGSYTGTSTVNSGVWVMQMVAFFASAQTSTITLTAIPSGQAFGTITATAPATLSLTGIVSSGAIGIPRLDAPATLNLTGIAGAGAFGAMTAAPTGTVSVSLTGILSQAILGTLSVDAPAFVTLLAMQSAQAFGVLVVDAPAFIFPNAISSTEAFGTLIAGVTGSAILALTGIPSAQAIGTLSATPTGTAAIALAGIPSREAFGTPTISGAGTATINLISIATSEIFGTGGVTTVGVAVRMGRIL